MNDRQMTIRDSALFVGCSPAFLLRLKRNGWLRTVAELQGRKDTARGTQKYYLWVLERLVKDIAYGLSLFDLAGIRMRSGEGQIALVARESGIPLRVVVLVSGSEFGWVDAFVESYALERNTELSLFRANKLITSATGRTLALNGRGAATRARTLAGLASLPPVRDGKRRGASTAAPLKEKRV